MSRWQPDALGRLTQAALELFRERGFDETTVAEIAARAGLTERTFFRYFADKREVLFSGSEWLRTSIVETLRAAPKTALPLEAVIAALEVIAAAIEERTGRAGAQERQAVILSHAELRERELIKLASLATAIREALRHRGVKEPTASLTAEAGIAVFKIGFERWLDDKKRRSFVHHVRAAMTALQAVMATDADAAG